MKYRFSFSAGSAWLWSVLLAVAWCVSLSAASDNRSLRILMIDSYSSAEPWSDELAHGFREELSRKNLSVIYEVSQLGVRNQPGVRPSADDIKSIQAKLDARPYDLLVACNNDAVDLFLNGELTVRNGTPLLAMSYIGVISPEQQKKFNVTGVTVPFQPERNAWLALQLKPTAPQIVYVVDASAEGFAARNRLAKLPPELAAKFTILSGSEYTTAEMLRKIAALPPDSVLMFHSWGSSREKNPETSMTALPRIRKVFPGLILGRLDKYLALGSSGGHLSSGRHQGQQAGEMAIGLLNGVRGETIPIQSGGLDPVLDYPAIGQYGIKESDVPSGIRIINRPIGFISRYSWGILIGISILFAALLLLSVFLLSRRRMQKELLELLTGLPNRLGAVDRNGRILYTHLPDYSGPTGSLNHLDDLPEEYREAFSQAVRSAFQGSGKVELDYTDGEQFRHAEFFRLPARNAFNTSVVIWISSNRTALHQAHRQITALAERFRLTLNSIGDGVIATDENEFVTLINPAAAQLTGYPAEQAVGKKMNDIFNIVSYIDGSKVASPLTRALQSGRTVELANHTDLIAQDGSCRHIADSASPLRGEDGCITGGVLVFRDVTEEYEQRDRFRMNSAILETVGKIAKFSYFRCHGDGTFPLQPQATKYWPLRDGRALAVDEWISPEDRQDFCAAWERLLGGEDEELCIRYSAGLDGEKSYFEMRAVKSLNEITQQSDFFGVIQDITEARREECRYRDNYRLLQSIMDNLPGYIFVKDVNDNFRNIICNRGLGELLGVDYRTLVGKFDEDLFPRDDAAVRQFHEDDMAMVKSGKPVEIRESFIDARGEKVVVHTCKNVFLQSDGTHLLIGIGFNITRQYELEEAQKHTIAELQARTLSEQILNQLLTMILLENDFTAAVNNMLRIIGENADADRCYIFRYEGDDQHYSSNDYEWVREGVAPEIDALQHVDMTLLGRWNDILLDKREIVIPDLANAPEELVAAQSILMPQNIKSLLVCGIWIEGRLWGYVGVDFVRNYHEFMDYEIQLVHNIVKLFLLARERMAQFNQIADSVALQRQIVDNIALPISIMDLDFSLVAANPRMAEHCGMSVEQLCEHKCYQAICREPEPPEWCPLLRTVRERKMYVCEHELFGRRLSITTQPIFDRNGDLKYVLKSDIDITELTHQKQDLQKAMEQAQAANRAKSYFLATMSHELRTPLNAVIGFSELLQHSNIEPQEQLDYLGSINCAGTALLNLINDILDLSKLEADQLPFSPSRTDAAKLISEVASVFRLKAREKSIELIVSSEGVQCPIYVDNLRLRQVMLNLIGNAIKFTNQGSVSVLAEFLPSETELTGTLDIRVIDTGIGIVAEDAQRIFDPFVQSEATRGNRVYEGSGLGLAISQRLVRRMGGEIELTSTPGQGSEFRIRLQGIRFDTELFPVSGVVPVEPVGVFAENLRVLLVDDVPLNLRVLQAMLRKINIESVCTGSGAEALALLREDSRFDLILTDIWMPGMDGMALATQIRTEFAHCRIPVIAVTADTQIAADAPEVFDGVLLKPITVEKLREIIRRENLSAPDPQ